MQSVPEVQARVGRRPLLRAALGLPVVPLVPLLTGCAADPARFFGQPLQAVAESLRVSEAAYVVLRGGRPQPAIGLSGTGTRVAPDGVFQAASLTKPVVAGAALRLAVAGRLDLDAPVSAYLPGGYRHFHRVLARDAGDPSDEVPASVLAGIRVAMLLNHTSGLPNWTSSTLAPQFTPGAHWQYAGEGFMLLQALLEAVTGQELNAWLQAELFQPLGLRDTSLVWRDDFAPRAVAAAGGGTAVRFRRAVAAASLYTTAADYAAFMAALWADRRVLDLTVSRPVPADPARGLDWGYGWGLAGALGGPCLWQWGNNPGFRAFAMLSVATGDGFVFLSNSPDGLALAASLAGQVLPETRGVFGFALLR